MKKQFLFLCVVVACFSFSPVSNAGTIVDTGEPPVPWPPVWSQVQFLSETQWLASQFTIGQSYAITGISGFMDGDMGDVLTIAIYGDVGEIPNVANQIYSGDFFARPLANWSGLSDLNWELQAGTYWVAFEVRDGSNFDGWMYSPANTPLDNGAVWSEGYYAPQDDLNLGIRIYGDPIATPEPASMLLLGAGLVGLAAFRKRIRKS